MVSGAQVEGVERSFTARPGRPFLIPLWNANCVGDPEAIFGTCVGADYEVDRDRVLRTDRLLVRVNGETVVDTTGRGAFEPFISQFFVDSGIFAVGVAPNRLISRFVEDFAPGTYWESYK
jgi:hypothetical protein